MNSDTDPDNYSPKNNIRRRVKSLSAGAVRSQTDCTDFMPKESDVTNNFELKFHNKSAFYSLIMGNKTNKVSSNSSDGKKDKGLYLSSDKVLDIIGYFNYSSIISHGLDDYLHGIIRGKLERKSALNYDSILTYFCWLIFMRNFSLAFIEDLQVRALLGETARLRPERQIVMVATFWSLWNAIVAHVYEKSTKMKFFSWLGPIQVLRGQSASKSYGLSTDMIEDWHKYTIEKWRKYLSFALIRSVLGIGFVVWICSERWKTSSQLFNIFQVFWTALIVLWVFYSSNQMYISYVYFNSLCYYFRMRYGKVNADIETIIAGHNRMKSNERSELLHHVLVEHNELCLKIFEYNRFWAKWLMATYFWLVAQMCFSLFQAFFTTNAILVRIFMFAVFIESSYYLTTISVNAALLSNTAHYSYRRLIRVTFDKYSVELQIQLRMFIQRLSGPTIGFYCLDLFEITYTTYASIIAALGQNFLLIVDFVRSYAEVGKSDDEIPEVLYQLSETVFNTTLSAMGLGSTLGEVTESSL